MNITPVSAIYGVLLKENACLQGVCKTHGCNDTAARAGAELRSWKGGRQMMILKRVYDPVDESDGTRLLIERLWPRGVKKASLKIDAWLKDVAPTTALRKWFSHDPAKWEEFSRRYSAELTGNPDAWQPIIEAARQGNVTLIYSSHDMEHNNAVVLKQFLNPHLPKSNSRSTSATREKARSKKG